MALPPLADISALAARLGRDLATEEYGRAGAALEDASALVRAEGRRDWWTEATGLTPPDAVVTVVLTAAKRVFDNPRGMISETVGPFTQRRADGETGVYLTEAEKAVVRRYRGTPSGLWTQRTTRGDPNNEGYGTVFLEDSFGCEPFLAGSYEDGVW